MTIPNNVYDYLFGASSGTQPTPCNAYAPSPCYEHPTIGEYVFGSDGTPLPPAPVGDLLGVTGRISVSGDYQDAVMGYGVVIDIDQKILPSPTINDIGKVLAATGDGLAVWSQVTAVQDNFVKVAYSDTVSGVLTEKVGIAYPMVSTILNPSANEQLQLSLNKASSSIDGYLGYNDFVIFNNKQNTIGYTPEDIANKSSASGLGNSDILYPTQKAVKSYVDNHTIIPTWGSITGTLSNQADLQNALNNKLNNSASSNFEPTLTKGNITYTNPISITGNLTNAVIGSGININISQASSSTNGYLSYLDWQNFNNKQASGSYLTVVIADTPLSGSGTSGSHLSINQASSSVNGYLSSTDWNTFNNKYNGLPIQTSASGKFLTTNGLIESWQFVPGPILDHASLTNLDYVHSGHTGFETTANKSTDITLGGGSPSNTLYPSQAAIKSYADSLIAANGAMVYKGTVGTGGTYTIAAFNALATYNIGWAFKCIEAGTIKGKVCEIADLIIAIVTRTGSGNVDADWTVVQANIDGAVIGPVSDVNGNFASFSGTTGKLIQDSGYSFSSFEPTLTKGNLTESTSSVLTISNGTGAVIGSGTTIQVKAASSSQDGVVNQVAQSFTGAKTFITPIIITKGADATARLTFDVGSLSTGTTRTVGIPDRSLTLDNITTYTTTNGTGFLKGNGSNISFDNSTYLTAIGTSSQFIKGDGSLDSNSYLTSEQDTLNTVLSRGNTSLSALTAGGIRSGSIGVDGQYSMYKHISAGVDWLVSLNPSSNQSANINLYLPPSYPASTYLLNMSNTGVIGYDSNSYQALINTSTNDTYYRGDKTFQHLYFQSSVANQAALPASGNTQGDVRITIDTNSIYIATSATTWIKYGTPSALTNYKGTWNANTNTPTITSGAGTDGDWYIVGTAGTTSIDGIASWGIGDYIWYSGSTSTWQKINNQVGATTSPGGLNGYIQFNSSGNFGGDSALAWDNTNKIISFGKWKPTTDSTTALILYKTNGTTVVAALDTTNSMLGLGLTPVSKLHQDAGNATANYHQFTCGTTTGVTATDGTLVGLDTTGQFNINQQEALAISVKTTGTERINIAAGGAVTISNLASAAQSVVSATNTGVLNTIPIVTGKLTDAATITLLTTAGNWTGTVYTGAAITGTYEGMYYCDAGNVYKYECYADNGWIRISRA